jgi:hypothetical protein
MRLLAPLVVVVALLANNGCKKSSTPETKTSSEPIRVEQLVSIETVGVFRQPPDMFFVLSYANELMAGLGGANGAAPCWTELTKKVKAGYQLSDPASAYFIAELEGPMPTPNEVIACVKTATAGDIVGKQAGELYVFTSRIAKMGDAYAAWRPPFIIVGNKQQVESALRTPTADTAKRWRELIAPVATAPTYMVRTDHMVDDIVGDNGVSYTFTMDKLEKTPRPFFAGRFIINYATPAAAEAGERHIRDWSGRGEFPRRVPDYKIMEHFDALAAGVQKTKITRTGTTLEIAFDTDMFGGAEAMAVALEKLGEGR